MEFMDVLHLFSGCFRPIKFTKLAIECCVRIIKITSLRKYLEFLAHLHKSTGSYCCYLDVGMGLGVGIRLRSFVTVFFFCFCFFVMGKILLGELSCTQTGLVRYDITNSQIP